MANVNIGGDAADRSYRYKMPRLLAKIEGRGNGIKTVIVNMVDIAKALHTEPAYPTKYFGIELGALSSYDKKHEKAVVNGAHQAADLASLLEGFIDSFILCPSCKLPEIRWKVRKSAIKIDCAACGHNSEMITTHRLATYIMKNPPEGSKSSDKKKKKKREKKKKKSRKDKEREDAERAAAVEDESNKKDENNNDDENTHTIEKKKKKEKKTEEIIWHSDTSKEAVEARKKKEFEEMKNEATLDRIVMSSSKDAIQEDPVIVMRQFINSSRGESMANVISELKRLKLSRGLDDAKGIQILVQSLLGADDIKLKDIPKILEKQSELLKQIGNSRQEQLIMIYCIEDFLCNAGEKYPQLMPHCIKTLFECDALDEEHIVHWFDSPPESDWIVSKEQATLCRKKAKAVVQWLKDADSESSDSDDE